MSKTITKHKENIRTYMRIMRKSLTFSERYVESVKISKIALNSNLFVNTKNIGLFFPFDGEINTYPLIKKLWSNKKKVFLPVIRSFNQKKLLFVHFTIDSILYYNKYKILEPFFTIQDIISVSDLDIIITPLVAFDQIGLRLGMGGGFYDILLEKWKEKKIVPVGYAYNFQLIKSLPRENWDIRLPFIFTPNKLFVF